jgi:excisionase family DNA binding protein
MLLTTQQAAELLRCTPDTVRAWASAGKVPAAKVGKSWLFDREQLADFIRATARRNVRECHSTDATAPPTGGSASQLAAVAFANLPAPQTRRRPKPTKPTLALVSGAKSG